MGEKLQVASIYRFPPATGPRHVAFSSDGRRLFLTEELTSGVASLSFDPDTAQIRLLDRVDSTNGFRERLNEPAEIRVHPNDRFVYVNNRGEDTLTWFSHHPDGRLRREGHVKVSHSDRPASGARNLVFDPTGQLLLVPDLAGDCVNFYAVDSNTGEPKLTNQVHVPRPAFVAVASA